MENMRYRCGWCLDGNHDHCVVRLQLKNSYYACPCDCNTTGDYTPENPRRRCIDCGRRDVATDDNSRCIDTDSCAAAIEKARRESPTWQQIDAAHAARDVATATVPPARQASPRKPRQATLASCRCCGEPTKGGAFLPGHDARFVSAQAAEIIAMTPEAAATRTRDLLDTLSPALFAKFTKRLDALRAKQAEEL